MGGKKKSLANKLAKMSDEERARYLQHKADMEEEARRRKEQLISTFLKKKIKKEEMFSRLNLAKINQQWHQILRKAKCQEMRENVEHMRNWIERLLAYKNRTISKLMEELQEAEEQYLNNFQSHYTHIDNVIEHQHRYIQKLQNQHDDDLKQLLAAFEAEKDVIINNAKSEEEYLKTMLFRAETEGGKELRAKYEHYKQKQYETETDFDEKMQKLIKTSEDVSGAIWKQIATVVRLYVKQTDSRRMHLAELTTADADSAAEIAENEERIRKQEDLIKSLKREEESLVSDRQSKLRAFEEEYQEVNLQFIKVKKRLQRELQIDEKQLKLLADTSSRSLQCLESLATKGEQIKNLAATCEKLQTHRETVSKWLPITIISDEYLRISKDADDGIRLDTNIEDVVPVPMNIVDRLSAGKSKRRPKTAISRSTLKSAKSITDTSTPDSRKVTTVKNVQAKTSSSSNSSSSDSSSSPTVSPDILERCLKSLGGMENFWFVFNKVEVDYMEMKEERKTLEKENKQLRGMIRAVLETAALAQTIPNSRVSTRAPSKSRSVQSAPLRRIVFA